MNKKILMIGSALFGIITTLSIFIVVFQHMEQASNNTDTKPDIAAKNDAVMKLIDRGDVQTYENGYYMIKDLEHIMYFDYATQKEVYLCNKPNCKHEDESCSSYLNIAEVNEIFYYDQHLYLVNAQEASNVVSINDAGTTSMASDNGNPSTVYRMDLDGTNREKLFTVPSGTQISMPYVIKGNQMFTFLEYYQTYLLEQSKQYAGKVNADDIAVMVQKQALIYIKYIVKITRMAVKKLLHTDSFLNINKADIFSIHAGEYKDYEEQIYYCSNKKLNNEKVVKTINNVENGQFYFKPYCDLDLSKLVLKKSNYCFTDFSNSNLAETDMRASFFVDAKFNHCNMQFCHLKYAAVFDADFECANLKGADISYAFGGMTVPNETTEYILGFSGVNFSKANLEYTDFSNSDFSGADFRGAMFQQTDFTGAYLKNALFYQKDLCKTNMTEEQINTIIISQEG